MKKVLLAWSSGKDSAWVLHVLRQDPDIEVAGLFTVLDEVNNVIPMHTTRRALLERQAEAAGLSLHVIHLPNPCTNEQSERIMGEFVRDAVGRGVQALAFGDLYLEDIREYRRKQLEGSGVEAMFPLWKMDTAELAETMLAAGVEAYVSSVDLKALPASVVGRKWSREMVDEFPGKVDPCGENGEIHTIVVNGPMFRDPVRVTTGEITERDGFAYIDIRLTEDET